MTKEEEMDTLSEVALRKLQTNNYYDALKAIEELHTFAELQDNETYLGKAENLYGLTYLNLYSYDEAESHFIKALEYNQIVKDTYWLALNNANLGHLNILNRDFDKAAKALKKAFFYDQYVGNRIELYIYESEVMRLYGQEKYDSLIAVAQIPLKGLYEKGHNKSLYRDKNMVKVMEQRYLITFELYLAFGLMESGGDMERANRLINKHKNKNLEEILWYNSRIFEQLYRINFYKQKYFIRNSPMLKDSIIFYKKQSKFYFQETVDFLKNSSASNNDILVTAIENEEKVRMLELNAEAARKQSRYDRNLTYLLAFLGLLAGLFLVYYKRSNSKIKDINFNLDKSNKSLIEFINNRDKFLAVVSHEIRTPLYALQELIYSIPDEYEEEEEDGEEYGLAVYSLLNLRHTVDNSLQYSRFNFFDNKVRVNPQPTDLAGVMEELKNYFKIMLRINQVELNVNLDVRNGIYKMAKTKISQILNNLVKNAVEFEGVGTVWVNVKEFPLSDRKSTLQFSVIDDGPGLTEETLEYVKKGEIVIADENSNKGIKLGLILCNQLLSLFESQLEFRMVGGTNVVSFKLDLEITENPYLSKIRPSKNQHKKILYVDDNPINLIITQRMITSLGYDCTTVDSGVTALKEVIEENYDLVLMDINMPEMDGYETSLKINALNSTLPILAYTALSVDEIYDRCYAAQIREVLTKPLTEEEFKRVLTKYLGVGYP